MERCEKWACHSSSVARGGAMGHLPPPPQAETAKDLIDWSLSILFTKV